MDPYYWRAILFSLAGAVIAVAGYHTAFSPPSNFPTDSIVVIGRGASIPEIASRLAEERIIKHPDLLRLLLRASGQAERVQAGKYLFNTPQYLPTVAFRLVIGEYGIPPVRITFPEGESVREMARRVSTALPDISSPEFLSTARPHEGYLFPDTYLFEPWVDAESIVQTMRENFDAKIAPYLDHIKDSGRTLSDTVILASLVEKEARSTEARRMVAGILLNRLERGMPLQVDAVFGYIFERDTYPPTFDDLKVDSPYNTYLHTGLPPGPINNPGLDSIEAALNPTETDYLYYLTGADNQMHYAKTYAEHQANQRRYLR